MDNSGPERGNLRSSLDRELRGITVGLAVLVAGALGFAFYSLGPILKPFFIAIFVYFFLKPWVDFMARHRIPRWASYVLLVFCITSVLSFVTVLFMQNLDAFEQRRPVYRERIEGWIESGSERLGILGEGEDLRADLREAVQGAVADLAQSAAGIATGLAGSGIAVFFYLVFIVLEEKKLPGRIARAYPAESAERIQVAGRNIHQGITRYLQIKTAIGLGTAITTAIILVPFGVEFWFLWVVTTFALNYIPYLGSIVASSFPFLVSLVQFSPWTALAIGVLLGLNQLFWGNLLEPRWLGRGLNINPLVLLFQLAFWGWLWGLTGMLLSVPLAVAIKIVLANFPSTERIAVLLSEE